MWLEAVLGGLFIMNSLQSQWGIFFHLFLSIIGIWNAFIVIYNAYIESDSPLLVD